MSYAALPPAPYYCEYQGYIYEYETEGGNLCIFPDGESCEIWEFLDGECGQEYVRDIRCRVEGELTFSFAPCCEGYIPKSELNSIKNKFLRPFGSSTCTADPYYSFEEHKRLNWFERFIDWFGNLF